MGGGVQVSTKESCSRCGSILHSLCYTLFFFSVPFCYISHMIGCAAKRKAWGARNTEFSCFSA